jgi:exopolysaccharide production protein ExoQ
MDHSLSIGNKAAFGRRNVVGAGAPIDWWLCSIASTALAFLQYSQTVAAYTFTAASAICVIREPGRSLEAVRNAGLVWLFVALCFLSWFWSPVPDFTLRGALQVTLTVGAALVFARAVKPSALLSATMGAILIASVASLLDPPMAWNAGALAMVGIFGSKNAFGSSQALLIMTCAWIALDAQRSLMARVVALLGIAIGFSLLIAARSVDSTAVALGAVGCAYFAFRLHWFPARWRPFILCMVILLVSFLLVFALLLTSDLFGEGLHFFGKDPTLSGRTVLWDRAAKLIEDNPILGTGFQGFWIEGNAYAEELWARFQPGRTGYNFHNLWFEMGVQFGYPGIILVFAIVAGTTLAVLRWVLRSPTPSSCFFLSYVIYADIPTLVESELLGQFSIPTMLLIITRVYARRSQIPAARRA